MKKIILVVMGVMLLFAFTFVSCKKENGVNPVSNPVSNLNIHQSRTSLVVYAKQCCNTESGKSGCECVVVKEDDDCSELTECEPDAALPTYNQVNHIMFTEAEIKARASNHVRITEKDLTAALKLDGFPVK